jgi:hypothetical protein
MTFAGGVVAVVGAVSQRLSASQVRARGECTVTGQLSPSIVPWRAHGREILIPRSEHRRPPPDAILDRGYAVARQARMWTRRRRVTAVALVLVALAGLAFSC